MKRFVMPCLVVATMAWAVPQASAQIIFSDGFESYAAGTLPPQGGWTDFGGSQPITVSTTQAHTGANSMRLSEGTDTLGGTSSGYGSDVFRNFLPSGVVNSGMVNLSWWQFVEPQVDSVAFMYISTGRMPTTFQTGLDLRTDTVGASGVGVGQLVVQDVGGTTPTLIAAPQTIISGAWVQHSITIDFVANLYSYNYNGATVVANAMWDTTPGDGVSLGGIDFWMQLGNANAVNNFVYYDDFSLVTVPEPSSLLLAPIGLAFWKLRRRK